MLKLAVMALVGAVSAVGAGQTLASLKNANQTPELRAAVAIAPQSSMAQPASIAKGRDGHYWAEADVNGSRVRFLVDSVLASADIVNFHPMTNTGTTAISQADFRRFVSATGHGFEIVNFSEL